MLGYMCVWDKTMEHNSNIRKFGQLLNSHPRSTDVRFKQESLSKRKETRDRKADEKVSKFSGATYREGGELRVVIELL